MPVGSTSNDNTPVIVNLDVLIDASGSLNVFGQAAPVVTNVITAAVELPVDALYDASGISNLNRLNSLFEFWEPSNALGTRKATLAGKDVAGDSSNKEDRDYKLMTKRFVLDLQEVLEGNFDCSGASPFSNAKYGDDYKIQSDFGRLALSTYAHYLFGHIGATAAITNDEQFMRAMLSHDASGNYKHANVGSVSGNDGANWLAGTTSDANLSELLVKAIITKNDAAILTIVEQVLGQDASRAMDQDNNQLAPGVRHELKFIPGDVIYMNIKLQTPAVTVSNGQGVAAATLEGKYSVENYTLKITLKEASEAVYA
jgi:hypothetical protein